MRIRYAMWALLLLASALSAPSSAWAQTGAVAGSVRSAETGAPVGGAVVMAIGPGGGTAASTLSDQSGRFRLERLAPGSYAVVASMTGYETRRMEGVRVQAGEATSLALELVARAIDLNPIVVSASRRQERALDAPARVEVVGGPEIDARPTVTPVDHLRSVPGVDIATTGLQSSNVVARGFNNVFSGALHALTDHRIAGVPSLRVNLMHLVPATNEDISRMEVVLGPGAALYGPNTANGVLHIMTKSPLAEQGTSVSVGGGEREVVHLSGRTAQLVGENFGVKLSGQYLRGNEWEFTDSAEVIEARKFASNPAFYRADLMRAAGIDERQATERIQRIGQRDFQVERWAGEARADWRVTPDLTTVFSVGNTMLVNGIELTGLGAAQAQDWRYTYVQARADWNRLFAQLYLNSSDAGTTYLLRNGAPIVDRSKLLVGQLQHGFSLGDRQSFTYGADYLHTMPETEGTINGIYENDDETREFGVYLQSETRLSPSFDLVLAGRVDTHSALPEAVFSPRAALVFKPAADQAFRVSYNRAFSTPSSLNQFLDLGSPVPNEMLARLGYSIRVQGTGKHGFTFRQPDGSYLMRSPFTPAGLGGPAGLLPANAAAFWSAAVGAVAVRAAAQGTPLPANLVQYLSSLRPTASQIGTNAFDVLSNRITPLSQLSLSDVDPIRESTSNTLEVGYKGILGTRLLLAADVWYSQRENLVTPLSIQTPLLLMNGQQIGAFLVPRLMQDLGMSQAQATALAAQLAPGLASVPVGVISSPSINANGAQLLTTYVNVDESINLWGTDLSAAALLSDRWQLGVAASWVSDDVFTTDSGMQVTLNAPRKKGSATLGYRDAGAPWNAELRVRYSDGYPVNSGVYIGTRCLGATGPLVEDCIASSTLLDATVGYTLPMRRGTSLQLSVQNLLDDRYRSFPGSPEIGRMALLRLRHEF